MVGQVRTQRATPVPALGTSSRKDPPTPLPNGLQPDHTVCGGCNDTAGRGEPRGRRQQRGRGRGGGGRRRRGGTGGRGRQVRRLPASFPGVVQAAGGPLRRSSGAGDMLAQHAMHALSRAHLRSSVHARPPLPTCSEERLVLPPLKGDQMRKPDALQADVFQGIVSSAHACQPGPGLHTGDGWCPGMPIPASSCPPGTSTANLAPAPPSYARRRSGAPTRTTSSPPSKTQCAHGSNAHSVGEAARGGLPMPLPPPWCCLLPASTSQSPALYLAPCCRCGGRTMYPSPLSSTTLTTRAACCCCRVGR